MTNRFMVIFLLLVGCVEHNYAQRSAIITTDKNFYLLTVLDQSSHVKHLIAADLSLKSISSQKTALLGKRTDASGILAGFKWSKADSVEGSQVLQQLYQDHQSAFDQLINRQLKPSGRYQRFNELNNRDFLLAAWAQCMKGMNLIIDRYGFGKSFRYPSIDSASYDVHNKDYENQISSMLSYLHDRSDPYGLFYQPTLSVALQLMVLNNRDEPSRFEPLENGENKAAAAKAKQTSWKRFLYSAIMVPGEGLEDEQRGISPIGKMRCDLAADRYFQKKAPFIIVSGGFVHPFQTPYCEAYEMKKYLQTEWRIPASAIIMEPQARHTTTNFRNSERLMIRYGFPLNKPALCVTTKDQADYIEDQRFDQRNLKELGYLPYRDKKRLGDHELSFFPVAESLHIDPTDPIDP